MRPWHALQKSRRASIMKNVLVGKCDGQLFSCIAFSLHFHYIFITFSIFHYIEILHLQSHFGRLLGILQAPCFSCCFPSKEYDKQDFKYLAQRVPTRKPPDLMFSSKVLQAILWRLQESRENHKGRAKVKMLWFFFLQIYCTRLRSIWHSRFHSRCICDISVS